MTLKSKQTEKDYLTKHFTLECNKCKNRDTILVWIFEDEEEIGMNNEIITSCSKCGNRFVIPLKGCKIDFEKGRKLQREEILRIIDEVHNRDIINASNHHNNKNIPNGESCCCCTTVKRIFRELKRRIKKLGETK